jgi:hypothetical protein
MPDVRRKRWSLSSLKDKLITIGANGRSVAFQMAEA